MCKNKQFNSWKSMSKKYFYKTKFLVTSFKNKLYLCSVKYSKKLVQLVFITCVKKV